MLDKVDTDKHIDSVCKLFDDRKELFISKNKDYSCSYIKSGYIIQYILDGKQPILVTAEDHIAYQLIVRKLDKLIRFCNLRFTKSDNLVDEKIYDTISDDGIYSFILGDVERNNINE